ncbi:MAG TPA: DoxX family protein, partial [Fibrobacteria bacterium]|nr:DoxX family protein [Fibrobacteria bacterium]
QLGYPGYILILLGAWKILGAAAVLIPKFPLIKEWAYAGIFFTMTGAIYSHIAKGNGMKELFPALLLLALAAISWYSRPPERKIASA